MLVGSSTSGDDNRSHPVRWGPDGAVAALALPAGYGDSYAEDVNNDGVVVGYGLSGSAGFTRGLHWDAAGTFTELAPLPGGYTTSMAAAVNDSGTVVGTSLGGGLRDRATRWNADGTVTDLGILPGGIDSRANGVNSHGEVVGFARGADAVLHAVRWAADGTMTVIGGAGSWADDVNDAGIAVGVSPVAGDDRPAAWSADGTLTSLPVLPGDHSATARAINGSATAVGQSGSPFRAVRWSGLPG